MPPPAPDLDPTVRELIRRKANRMCRGRGFDRQDREDIEQELTLCYLQRQGAHDAARGPVLSFAAVVLANCARNLVRRQRAGKRDPRRLRPLGGAAGGALGGDAHAARLGRQPSPDLDQALLAHDVAGVLTRLPPPLRELAEELKTHSLGKIARRRGVPRSTLQADLRRLAGHFRDAGLKDFR